MAEQRLLDSIYERAKDRIYDLTAIELRDHIAEVTWESYRRYKAARRTEDEADSDDDLN